MRLLLHTHPHPFPIFVMTYGKILASAMTATLALGSALPALATDGTSSSSTASSTSSSSVSSSSSSRSGKGPAMRVDNMRKIMNNKKFDPTCIKSAVEAREKSIQAAWATFSASMTSAFSVRGSSLATAWSNTDAAARRTAIKAAWDTFKKSARSARETWKTAQKTARKTFKEAGKKCGIPAEDVLHGVEPDEIDMNVQ